MLEYTFVFFDFVQSLGIQMHDKMTGAILSYQSLNEMSLKLPDQQPNIRKYSIKATDNDFLLSFNLSITINGFVLYALKC